VATEGKEIRGKKRRKERNDKTFIRLMLLLSHNQAYNRAYTI